MFTAISITVLFPSCSYTKGLGCENSKVKRACVCCEGCVCGMFCCDFVCCGRIFAESRCYADQTKGVTTPATTVYMSERRDDEREKNVLTVEPVVVRWAAVIRNGCKACWRDDAVGHCFQRLDVCFFVRYARGSKVIGDSRVGGRH
jgi:hypothetical protein